MESVVRVKRSLRRPIRKLTSCVSGVKERQLCAKRRRKKNGRGGAGGRGASSSRLRKTPPPRAAHPKYPSSISSYQADLERERKLREAKNAQKNAERAAMRAHFRRKYHLSESYQDTSHFWSVGGKVSLPSKLSKIIRPDSKSKESGFNLLTAFQGLSFDSAVITGSGAHRKTPVPAQTRRDSCKVM